MAGYRVVEMQPGMRPDYIAIFGYGIDNSTLVTVYDAKLTSAGTCGSIAGVIDPILTAMFDKFPGESGRTRTVDVKWDSRSC